jgi:hypothetical protein
MGMGMGGGGGFFPSWVWGKSYPMDTYPLPSLVL